MGILDCFKKKPELTEMNVSFPIILEADAKGSLIPLEQIQDEVFSQGVLGKGCGIIPSEGAIYAPLDGKVSQIADSLHAIGLEGIGGIEVLIHVGIDTINMDGDGFHSCVRIGESIKKGQLLLTMDLEKIKEAGYSSTVITIVTNSDDFDAVDVVFSGVIEPGKDMLRISK